MTAAICTRDRPAQLRRALASLFDQTVRPAEVLVVVNAPRDRRTETLLRDEFPQARYLEEPVPGLDFARNTALRAAAHEIVAFLDDDAVADRGWTAAIARVFRENERVAVCTGKVDALSLESEGSRLFEANGGFARGEQRIHLRPRAERRDSWMPLIARSIGVGSGCSMAVRRSLVLERGGFDEALDLGAVLPGGGDLDLLWRMLDAGWEVVYEPAAAARHEHRRDFEAAARQIAEHNRSLVAMLMKAAARTKGRRRLEVLVFLLWRLGKPGVRLLRRAVRRDPVPTRVLARVWWASIRGLWTYPAARRHALRLKERA